ncbi:hypothetical protein AURDEDRAFT_116032 [Auricularia subglabra TFB-10046 SS5]|nr:hypothetical protein AURDEDRAFT_116032 [Auricularia subglabra TFB-10046 SS5]
MSRAASTLLALTAFAAVAYASPVASREVAAVATDPLTVILNLCLDLKAKIDAIISIMIDLDVKADISVYIGQIVVLVHACVAALLKVGVVVDLSHKDHIAAIAHVCADIIVSISGCVGVFASILVNLTACITLDIAIQAWLVQLNLCVGGVLSVIAPLCVSITGTVNLALTLVIALLGL